MGDDSQGVILKSKVKQKVRRTQREFVARLLRVPLRLRLRIGLYAILKPKKAWDILLCCLGDGRKVR